MNLEQQQLPNTIDAMNWGPPDHASHGPQFMILILMVLYMLCTCVSTYPSKLYNFLQSLVKEPFEARRALLRESFNPVEGVSACLPAGSTLCGH